MGNQGKSYRIQIAVAVIGLVGVLGAALISNWDKIFPPSPEPEPIVVTVDDPVEDTRNMTILFNINPLNQREGKPTKISVKVVSDTGEAVEGARVHLRALGGTFERSAHHIVNGRTNSDGVFLGVWRSRVPGAGDYSANASVIKEGFNNGANSVSFRIIGE